MQNHNSTLPEKTDILVIGSGLAGAAAACEAAGTGAEVFILEKMKYNGGNSALAGGGYACYTSSLHMRERLGLGEDSWEAHKEDTLKAGKYLNDPDLVETLAKNAPAGMDWLTAAGVPFKEVLVQLGGYSAPRAYQAACSGKVMMDHVKEFAENTGVHYLFGCTVTGLLREENGPVTGVTCRYQDKDYTIFANKAVILATGGFSRDIDMRKAVRPDLDETFGCSNHKGATGEMIRYAQAIGADTVDLDQIQLYPCANPNTGSVDRWAFYCYSGAGFGMIYTDGTGRRFINELEGRAGLSDAQIQSCVRPTWSVLNREIIEKLGMTEKEVSDGERLGRMLRGETLPDLARQMGADASVLEETVRLHNQMITTGAADEFGKMPAVSFCTMETGPYYAIAQWPAVHFTLGGLKINTQARVLDENGRIIPRLFAAGEVCGGVHGADRMGGNALAECVVFGRIAGQNAAVGTSD